MLQTFYQNKGTYILTKILKVHRITEKNISFNKVLKRW